MNPIVEYIKDKGGFISRQEIADDTIYTQLLKEVEKGNIMRLKAGVYALPEALAKPMVDMFNEEFFQDPIKINQWNSFLQKIKYKDQLTFPDVGMLIQEKIKPYWEALAPRNSKNPMQ